MKLISVVSPCYKEEGNVKIPGKLLARISP